MKPLGQPPRAEEAACVGQSEPCRCSVPCRSVCHLVDALWDAVFWADMDRIRTVTAEMRRRLLGEIVPPPPPDPPPKRMIYEDII